VNNSRVSLRFAVILLAACAAFGQETKVFQFTHDQSPSDLYELATLLKGIVGIPQLSVDNVARTLTVKAPSPMIQLVGWLVQKLDVPADRVQPGLPGEYTSSAWDVVCPFMTAAPTSDALENIATAVRTMGEMQQVFVYKSLKAVVLRTATSQQFSAAAWVVGLLDSPKDVPTPQPNELELSDGETLRAFELTHTPVSPIELCDLVHIVADAPRVLSYCDRNILMVRERTDKLALTAWLVNELDRPAIAQAVTGESLVAHEYPIALQDRKARVFYLPPPPPYWNDAESGNYALKAAAVVRMNSGTAHASGYTLANAVAVLGTPDELAMARNLLEDFIKRPPE
jgi:hypothetical protein